MKRILLSTIAIISFVFADFNLHYTLDGQEQMNIAYKDATHVKITTTNKNQRESSSQLIVGNRHFIVMDKRGKKEYIDIDKLNQQFGQFGDMMQQQTKPTFKVLKKGKYKKIAGIDVQKWLVEVNDNGHIGRTILFVTNNQEFVNALEKLSDAMDSFSGNDGQSNMFSSFLDLQNGYAIVEAEGMHLNEFNTNNVDSSIFELSHKVSQPTKTIYKNVPTNFKACSLGSTGQKAVKMSPILSNTINDWKLIDNKTCINVMGMRVEGAIYKKGNEFTRLTLSINVDGENGLIAKYKMNNMQISDYKRGKINGFKYQMAHVGLANEYVLDIKLPNAILSLDSPTNQELDRFVKNLKIDQFEGVKKTTPEKHMKKVFKNSNLQNSKDMRQMNEMLQNLMGK